MIDTADLRKARRRERAPADLDRADKLPPHAPEAEQGVLGCILLSPNECLRQCQDKFGSDEAFFDLRHATIWHTLVYLAAKDKPIDLISVQQELKDRGQLEQIGGIPYLNALQDCVPSAANLTYYLEIVWEKYLWRRLIKKNTDEVGLLYEHGGAVEEFVTQVNQKHEDWKALLDRGAVTPKHLKPPNEFIEQYYAQWFDRREDSYGYPLPFEFPLRFRPAATSLMTGDNGSGKSTMLCLLAGHIATKLDVNEGETLTIASMEMRPEVTLWIMARQLLGVGHLDRTAANEQKVCDALAWLNTRVRLYDFLGITNRHELLQAFEYAAAHLHSKFFILDNLMKVGIADDDYAEQGFFMQRVCDFDLKHNAHTIVVVHENKGDGNAKQKVRGSKQLTDAPDNVIGMKRNEQKAEKLEELKAEKAAKKIDEAAYNDAVAKQRFTWDSKFVLSKQRWPGAQQNGSKWLYFDKPSLRFQVRPDEPTLPLITLPKPKQQT